MIRVERIMAPGLGLELQARRTSASDDRHRADVAMLRNTASRAYQPKA